MVITPRRVQLHAGDLQTFVHGMHLGQLLLSNFFINTPFRYVFVDRMTV